MGNSCFANRVRNILLFVHSGIVSIIALIWYGSAVTIIAFTCLFLYWKKQ